MRFSKKKFGLAIASLSAVLTLGVATSGVAHATSGIIEQCGNGGSGYCLNDWGGGGSGNAVKMYNGGFSNDAFQIFGVNACDGSDIIQSDCLSGWGNAPGLVGAEIIRVIYTNNSSLCVGSDSSGHANLGACGNSTGAGAAQGVIMALNTITGCTNDNQHLYVDRFWTNANRFKVYLDSGGNPGVQALFSQNGATCWGNVIS